MANPYKKAEEHKKVSPGGHRKEETTAPVTPVEPTAPVTPVEEKEKPVNPLAGKIDKKPEGKSYGFYLSNEAIAKLEKLAKQNKCSKSKALDLLLRNIL